MKNRLFIMFAIASSFVRGMDDTVLDLTDEMSEITMYSRQQSKKIVHDKRSPRRKYNDKDDFFSYVGSDALSSDRSNDSSSSADKNTTASLLALHNKKVGNDLHVHVPPFVIASGDDSGSDKIKCCLADDHSQHSQNNSNKLQSSVCCIS